MTGDFHHLLVNPLEKSGNTFLQHKLRCLSGASADESKSLFITHSKKSPYSLQMLRASRSNCIGTFSLSSPCSSWCKFPSLIKNSMSLMRWLLLFNFLYFLTFLILFYFFFLSMKFPSKQVAHGNTTCHSWLSVIYLFYVH